MPGINPEKTPSINPISIEIATNSIDMGAILNFISNNYL
jgi:hypothetical protein